MSEAHRIRLRGPWEIIDGVRHVRRFGKPRSGDPMERVWLVIEGGAWSRILLNEIALSAIGQELFRGEVTGILHERNRLEIQIDPGASLGEVCLEIARIEPNGLAASS